MIHRITERRDFDRLRSGRRSSGSFVWVRFVADPECVPPRVAFAIGRRHGSAVRRNRIRRRLRAILADPELRPPAGVYLFGWRHQGDEPAFSDLASDVRRTLARLNRP